MNKVITINLNGKAYNAEEAGFVLLRNYLEKAKEELASNPDQAEIVRDLEEALARKCDLLLSDHKNVVTEAEIKKILEEMGPVKDAESEKNTKESGYGPRRLYRVREGALITGVCNGLALYFNIDVTLVRLIFIVLTVVTGGGFIFAYILMTVFIHAADTPERKAAAFNIPESAQELVNRAKEYYANFRDHDWKGEQRKFYYKANEWKQAASESYHARNSWADVVRPLVDTVVGIIWIAFFLLLAAVALRHTDELNILFNHVSTWLRSF